MSLITTNTTAQPFMVVRRDSENTMQPAARSYQIRPYQTRLVQSILNHCLEGRSKVVLAADTCAGKTEMSFAVLNAVLEAERAKQALERDAQKAQKIADRERTRPMETADFMVAGATLPHNRGACGDVDVGEQVWLQRT